MAYQRRPIVINYPPSERLPLNLRLDSSLVINPRSAFPLTLPSPLMSARGDPSPTKTLRSIRTNRTNTANGEPTPPSSSLCPWRYDHRSRRPLQFAKSKPTYLVRTLFWAPLWRYPPSLSLGPEVVQTPNHHEYSWTRTPTVTADSRCGHFDSNPGDASSLWVSQRHEIRTLVEGGNLFSNSVAGADRGSINIVRLHFKEGGNF